MGKFDFLFIIFIGLFGPFAVADMCSSKVDLSNTYEKIGDQALPFFARCSKLQHTKSDFIAAEGSLTYLRPHFDGDQVERAEYNKHVYYFVPIKNKNGPGYSIEVCSEVPCDAGKVVALMHSSSESGEIDSVDLTGEMFDTKDQLGSKGMTKIKLNQNQLLDSISDGKSNSDLEQLKEQQRDATLKAMSLQELENEKTPEQKCSGIEGDPAKLFSYLAQKYNWNPANTKFSDPGNYKFDHEAMAAAGKGLLGVGEGMWDSTVGAAYGLGKGAYKLSSDKQTQSAFKKAIISVKDKFENIKSQCTSSHGTNSVAVELCTWGKISKAAGTQAWSAAKEKFKTCTTTSESEEFGKCMGEIAASCLASAGALKMLGAGEQLSARAARISESGGRMTVGRQAVVDSAQASAKTLVKAGVVVDQTVGVGASAKNSAEKSTASVVVNDFKKSSEQFLKASADKNLDAETLKATKNNMLQQAAKLTDPERLQAAEFLVGKPLTEGQKQAVFEAHLIGKKEGHGFIDGGSNYTKTELKEKYKKLIDAGFSKDDAQKLVRTGVTGDVAAGKEFAISASQEAWANKNWAGETSARLDKKYNDDLAKLNREMTEQDKFLPADQRKLNSPEYDRQKQILIQEAQGRAYKASLEPRANTLTPEVAQRIEANTQGAKLYSSESEYKSISPFDQNKFNNQVKYAVVDGDRGGSYGSSIKIPAGRFDSSPVESMQVRVDKETWKGTKVEVKMRDGTSKIIDDPAFADRLNKALSRAKSEGKPVDPTLLYEGVNRAQNNLTGDLSKLNTARPAALETKLSPAAEVHPAVGSPAPASVSADSISQNVTRESWASSHWSGEVSASRDPEYVSALQKLKSNMEKQDMYLPEGQKKLNSPTFDIEKQKLIEQAKDRAFRASQAPQPARTLDPATLQKFDEVTRGERIFATADYSKVAQADRNIFENQIRGYKVESGQMGPSLSLPKTNLKSQTFPRMDVKTNWEWPYEAKSVTVTLEDGTKKVISDPSFAEKLNKALGSGKPVDPSIIYEGLYRAKGN